MLKAYKFSKNDFEKRMMIYRSSYDSLIGSATAQRIADTRVISMSCLLYQPIRQFFISLATRNVLSSRSRAALKERAKEYKARERPFITSRNEMLKPKCLIQQIVLGLCIF